MQTLRQPGFFSWVASVKHFFCPFLPWIQLSYLGHILGTSSSTVYSTHATPKSTSPSCEVVQHTEEENVGTRSHLSWCERRVPWHQTFLGRMGSLKEQEGGKDTGDLGKTPWRRIQRRKFWRCQQLNGNGVMLGSDMCPDRRWTEMIRPNSGVGVRRGVWWPESKSWSLEDSADQRSVKILENISFETNSSLQLRNLSQWTEGTKPFLYLLCTFLKPLLCNYES